MTYQLVASISQVTSLLMFIAMFIAVVAYAMWPSNRARFEEAQRQALDLDKPMRAANPGERGQR